MKKLAIIDYQGSGVADSIKSFFRLREDVYVNIYSRIKPGLLDENDLVVFLDGKPFDVSSEFAPKILVTHSSLLPAFDTDLPIKDAYLAGVKVSGVTVRYADGRIVAQFPVLIDYNTDFKEFELNILKTEKMFYPLVIKSIIDNKPFSFSDVMGNSSAQSTGCSGGCSSCTGCH